MSFTITCDECGYSMKMKDKDCLHYGNIDIVVDVSHHYSEYIVHGVDLYCENERCLNSVFIKEN